MLMQILFGFQFERWSWIFIFFLVNKRSSRSALNKVYNELINRKWNASFEKLFLFSKKKFNCVQLWFLFNFLLSTSSSSCPISNYTHCVFSCCGTGGMKCLTVWLINILKIEKQFLFGEFFVMWCGKFNMLNSFFALCLLTFFLR